MKRSKRLPFTERENQIIRESVKRFGEDWDAISRRLPGRTPKQIHDRYINYLRDGLKSGPWSNEEDEVLIQMYNLIGPKWSRMMSSLPGRSGNDIKNRWHKHLIKKVIQPTSIDNEITSNSNIEDINNDSKKSYFSELNQININNNAQMDHDEQSYLINNYSDGSSNNSFSHKNEAHFRSKSEQKESSYQHNLPFEMKCFDIEKTFNELMNFNCENCEKIKDQDQLLNHSTDSVRIVSKVDISHNLINSSNINIKESNQMSEFNSSIFKDDFEFQELIEDFNSRNLDFQWL